MSLTKFKIERTGEFFYYDNKSSVLLDNNKKRLALPVKDPSAEAELKGRFGRNTKDNNPETIKITLGHGCNYSCGYCMQKDIGNPDERPANGMTPMLIKNIRRNLDISETNRIELWGGETLLYWNDIQALMTEFDHEGITWYIPTNGTPLMDKHLDFFMQLKGEVAIGISHDGPAHEELRGKEFIHKKVEVFRRIQDECYPKVQFSFNPVISNTNYDLFKINDFFHSFLKENNLKPVALSYELGRVYDEQMAENSAHHVISGDDIPKYKEILRRYLSTHLEYMETNGYSRDGELLPTNLFHIGAGVVPFAQTLRHEKTPLLKTNCGADDSRLISLDLMGNVHACQNTDDSFIGGSLVDLKGAVISRITTDRDDFCGECPVARLCRSSCPLELGSAVFHTNHAIEVVHYSEILLAAFRLLFKSDISFET